MTTKSFRSPQNKFMAEINYSDVIDGIGSSTICTANEIEELNSIIIDELVDNKLNMGSKFYINSIIDNLLFNDIDSLILGCTELGSIIKEMPSQDIKIINSLELHIEEIVDLVFRKNL